MLAESNSRVDLGDAHGAFPRRRPHKQAISGNLPIGRPVVDGEILAPSSAVAGRDSPSITMTASRPSRPLRVAVIGVSMAHVFRMQLAINGHHDGAFSVYYDVRASSGLTRPDIVDWPARARAVVAQWRPDVVILVFGANDAEDLRQGNAIYHFGRPAWRGAYGDRVSTMLDIATHGGRRVLWVGMPMMRSVTFSEKMRTINTVVREQTSRRSHVTFVDAWQRFQGPDGLFTARLPDASGRQLLVRETDGIHYTHAGGRLLATDVAVTLRGIASGH